MSYQALYRTYRPRKFSDVKGQEAIISVLRSQISAGAPSHAYLFSGPRGTGKTTVARIVAMALNCLDPQNGEPCLECENCRAALADNMPDIIEIDAASNNSVDNARDIREKVSLPPVCGKYKIYIIDEAHMLSNSAFNALLKTLEEPPDYAVFIFATTELRKIIPTVLSRCQRFDFHSIDDQDITGRLREVADSAGIAVSNDALEVIAKTARGGLRDALTLFEKCASVSSDIDRKTACEVLGLADAERMDKLIRSVLQYDEAAALSALSEIFEGGVAAADAASQMSSALSDMLMDAVRGKADAWDKRALLRAIELLSTAESEMRFAVRPELLLESAVLRILLPETASDIEALSARIKKLESRPVADPELLSRIKTLESAPAATPTASAPPKAPTQKKKAPAPREARAIWDAALKLAEHDPGIMPIIAACTPIGRDGSNLIIAGKPGKIEYLETGSSLRGDIEKYVSQAAEEDLKLRVEHDPEEWDTGIEGLEEED